MTQLSALEQLVAEAQDGGEVSEVIRPAAVLSEESARAVLAGLSDRDIQNDGEWSTQPARWERFQRLAGPAAPRIGEMVGYIQVIYGQPTRYDITLYRVVITPAGSRVGWTVQSLCDEALAHAGLTLATCPRASMKPPPKPFRMRDQRSAD